MTRHTFNMPLCPLLFSFGSNIPEGGIGLNARTCLIYFFCEEEILYLFRAWAIKAINSDLACSHGRTSWYCVEAMKFRKKRFAVHLANPGCAVIFINTY